MDQATDPRTATFDDEAARALDRVRRKTEAAQNTTEAQITATLDLVKSADFRDAARKDAELRDTIGTVTQEVDALRKAIQVQKSLFTPPKGGVKKTIMSRLKKRPA